MSATNHWMRFHVGDYLADTMHLSTLQHGIYFLLIMHYFKRGDLPHQDDQRALRLIAKVPQQAWNKFAPSVLSLFKTDSEGRFRHSRIDQERSKSEAWQKTQEERWKNGDSHTRERQHHSEPEPDSKNPPRPPSGGRRGRGHVNGVGKERQNRNGFTDVAADLIAEHDHVETPDDPREGGARVVHLARRANGH